VGERELERRAAGGDADAALQLARIQLGRGHIDAGLLAQAGPRAARLLPPGLKAALLRALLLDASVERLEPELVEGGVLRAPEGTGPVLPVGWFPHHALQNVCPRGHALGPNNPFRFNTAGDLEEWDYAYAGTADTLFLHGDWNSNSLGIGVSVTECLGCWAKWPSRKVQG
jgi:hypothetical protein